MRRRPVSNHVRGKPRSIASPAFPVPPSVPTTQGDAIDPFLVGGGSTFYLTGQPLEPYPTIAFNAVQLVCSQYVPPGRIAFIKSIAIAPCAPPVLVDPWRGWAGFWNLFEASPDPHGAVQRAPAQAGLWETPLAWEGYFTAAQYVAGVVPRWQWFLTLFPGDARAQRAKRGVGPFNIADPATYWMAPDVAVPGGVYASGLPGNAVGLIGGQRFQALPTAPLVTHILCAEDTTICLWARWTQTPIDPVLAQGPNGPIQVNESFDTVDVVPLLPSVGRLHGYMQPATRAATAHNAAFGWGG